MLAVGAGLLVFAATAHAQNAAPQNTAPQNAGPAQPGAAGQPPAQGGQQGEAQPWVQAPFVLNVQEQNNIDLVLRQWQQTGAQVKTFECDFTVWTYNAAFGPGPDKPMRTENGVLRYATPDKGMYKIESEGGEHWLCDGKAIFEFRSSTKQLIENRLPPQLQGKAIADGPLPFVFGVDAEKLKQRYWIRIITPQGATGQIWLQAFPRTRQDAANFDRVEIILSDKTLLPEGLQLVEPQGKNRKAYAFANLKVNNPVHIAKGWIGWFVAPQTPIGWERIVNDPSVTPQGGSPPGVVGPPGQPPMNQAQRPNGAGVQQQ
jgi:TIGR03009 family protein